MDYKEKLNKLLVGRIVKCSDDLFSQVRIIQLNNDGSVLIKNLKNGLYEICFLSLIKKYVF